MYTHETLIKEYEKQTINKQLCSQPIRMFDEHGNFNPSNWNGGDSNIIRRMLYDINYQGHFHHLRNGFLDIDSIWIDDTTHVIITETILMENDDTLEHDIYTTRYVLSWYKNRGRIDKFDVDEHEGNEQEYLDLLNMLKYVIMEFGNINK